MNLLAVFGFCGCVDNGGRIDILIIVAVLIMVAVLRMVTVFENGGCIGIDDCI